MVGDAAKSLNCDCVTVFVQHEELTLENVIFLARRGLVQEAWELMLR